VSHPAGHTSWSTSGLAYLTFWLLGKLRCFDGGAHPSRFVLSIAPLLGAVWIGMSRVQDYWCVGWWVVMGWLCGCASLCVPCTKCCFYRACTTELLLLLAVICTSGN